MSNHPEIIHFVEVLSGKSDPSMGFWRSDGKPLTWRRMLEQTIWWRTQDGTWRQLEEITPSHAANIIQFLERRTPRLRFQADMDRAFDAYPTTDLAYDAYLSKIDAEDALDDAAWLASMPLIRALQQRAEAAE